MFNSIILQNTEFRERYEESLGKEQKLKKQYFEVKTELEVKEQEFIMIAKLNEELKQKLDQGNQVIEDLTQENDVSVMTKNIFWLMNY